jgi:hypothetical protein
MTGPVQVCDCGLAYVAVRGRPACCFRCAVIDGFVGKIIPSRPQEGWGGRGRKRKPYVDEYTDRRRAQYRASKIRARARVEVRAA